MSSKINFASLRKTTTVEGIPEMGGLVTLQQLSVSELEEIQSKENNSALQLAYSIVDNETKKRIYTTDEDIANLGDMPTVISRRLFPEINKLNGFGATEQTAKNS